MQKRPHRQLPILAYHGLRALRRKEQLKCRFPFFWRAAFAIVRIVLLPAPAIDTMDDIEKVSAVQEAAPATAPAGVRSSVSQQKQPLLSSLGQPVARRPPRLKCSSSRRSSPTSSSSAPRPPPYREQTARTRTNRDSPGTRRSCSSTRAASTRSARRRRRGGRTTPT